MNSRQYICKDEPNVLCCAFVFYLRPVSCVPNVVSFSGMSILDCPFGFVLHHNTELKTYILTQVLRKGKH